MLHGATLQEYDPDDDVLKGVVERVVLENKRRTGSATGDLSPWSITGTNSQLDFTACLGPLTADDKLLRTLGAALQIAGAKLLEVDVREIGVMVDSIGVAQGYSVVLYDNVPGGAGHVRGLVDLGINWLKEAREALYVDATKLMPSGFLTPAWVRTWRPSISRSAFA